MARVVDTTALNRRRIKLANDSVDLEALLAELGIELRRTGERWRGKCPLCGEDSSKHSDAFSLSPEVRVWKCFRCDCGGDLVRLVKLVSDFPYDATAAAWIGHRFGIDLPARPDSWFRKQDRQGRIREQIREKRRDVLRRRLFVTFIIPLLEDIEDEGEQDRQIDAAWENFKDLPVGGVVD